MTPSTLINVMGVQMLNDMGVQMFEVQMSDIDYK